MGSPRVAKLDTAEQQHAHTPCGYNMFDSDQDIPSSHKVLLALTTGSLISSLSLGFQFSGSIWIFNKPPCSLSLARFPMAPRGVKRGPLFKLKCLEFPCRSMLIGNQYQFPGSDMSSSSF